MEYILRSGTTFEVDLPTTIENRLAVNGALNSTSLRTGTLYSEVYGNNNYKRSYISSLSDYHSRTVTGQTGNTVNYLQLPGETGIIQLETYAGNSNLYANNKIVMGENISYINSSGYGISVPGILLQSSEGTGKGAGGVIRLYTTMDYLETTSYNTEYIGIIDFNPRGICTSTTYGGSEQDLEIISNGNLKFSGFKKRNFTTTASDQLFYTALSTGAAALVCFKGAYTTIAMLTYDSNGRGNINILYQTGAAIVLSRSGRQFNFRSNDAGAYDIYIMNMPW